MFPSLIQDGDFRPLSDITVSCSKTGCWPAQVYNLAWSSGHIGWNMLVVNHQSKSGKDQIFPVFLMV
jgi:hypothetical protein